MFYCDCGACYSDTETCKSVGCPENPEALVELKREHNEAIAKGLGRYLLDRECAESDKNNELTREIQHLKKKLELLNTERIDVHSRQVIPERSLLVANDPTRVVDFIQAGVAKDLGMYLLNSGLLTVTHTYEPDFHTPLERNITIELRLTVFKPPVKVKE